ncbi:MAG: response regulator [Gammaproteobacteria bacterium]|nr:MAG: response regulator [Gammaproteobacteria bacterium]
MKKLIKILYAEDEPDIREIAKVSLEEIGGFIVYYCCTGAEVLEAVKQFQPDLLLLDVMMPDMDGPTALKKLREPPNCIDIPAIFMTAKIQSNEMCEYKDMGVLTVISKPFDPIKLPDMIKIAWEKHHERCE